MGKIYNIVLNSSYGTAPVDIRNVTFYYDWTRFEEGRYKLSFTFITSTFTTTNVSVCNIFTDLCQTNCFFALNPSNTNSISNSYNYQYLGMAISTGLGTNQNLYTPANLNGEIYLESRPYNNLFSVLLLNNDTGKTAYSSTSLPGNYTINLCFEKLD